MEPSELLTQLEREEKLIIENDMSFESIKVFKGEQPISNPPKPRKKKSLKVTIEIGPDLYNFLINDAEDNERTIAQSIRYWLKRATDIRD